MIIIVHLFVVIRKISLEYLPTDFGTRIYVLNNNPYICRIYPGTGHEDRSRWEVDIQLYSFFNLGARWEGWSTPRPGCFSPGKDQVPIVYEVGLASGRVWRGDKNLATHRNLIPGRSSP
jgi:hypothetical protein